MRRPFEVMGLIMVFGVTLAVFSGAFEGFFVQDDFGWLESTRFTSLGEYLKSFSRFNPAAGYRPLSQETIFFVGQKIFGMWPPGFHLLSLLFHLLATLLTFFLLREFFSPLPSLTATLFFSIHSAHVWGVYWISAIAEPMALVFFLASLILFIRFDKGGSRFVYAGSLIAMGTGIMCKESILSLPLILITYCIIFSRRRLFWTLPHIILTGFYFIMRATSTQIQVSPYPLEFGSEAWQNLAAYLSWSAGFSETTLKRILGWNYEVSYPIIAIVLVAAMTALLLLTRRKDVALFSLLWFMLALQPVLYFSHHIYPYYLAPALPAIALLLASVLPAERRLLDWKALLPALTLILYISWLSVPSIRLEGSWWVERSLQGRDIMDQMSSIARTLPEDDKAYIFGFQPDVLGILQNDAAFKAYGISPQRFIIFGLDSRTTRQIQHLFTSGELERYHCYVYEDEGLIDKTESFRANPTPFLGPQPLEYRMDPDVRLVIVPLSVEAGVDYLTLRAVNLTAPAIDILYTLDGELMPPVLDWLLDENHETTLFVDDTTATGLYHFIGIRDARSEGDSWIRTDVKVHVR